MAIKFPTWVSEHFLLKIEGLKLLGLPNHPFRTGGGAGRVPLAKNLGQRHGRT
jgi:hypothetical protein